MSPQKLILIFLFVLPAIPASLLSQCGDNLVQNPGFENIVTPCTPPSPPNLVNGAFNTNCVPFWSAAWGTPSICTQVPFAGSQYACYGANNEGSFTQLSLCPGYYDLSFQYRKLGGPGNDTLLVYMANGLMNQPMSNSGNPPLVIDPSWQLLAAVPLNMTGSWFGFSESGITIPNTANNQLLFIIANGLADAGVDEVFFGPSLNAAIPDLSLMCANQTGNTIHFSLDAMDAPPGFINGTVDWDFGDGNVGTGEIVSHTFIADGTYLVCATFQDGCNCSYTICREALIGPCNCNCGPDDTPPFANPTFEPLIELSCDDDPIPPVPVFTVQDDCDPNPTSQFNEMTSGDDCDRTITRQWTVGDACGNTTILEQIITIRDTEAPVYLTVPQNITVACNSDILGQFNTWVFNNGNSVRSDNCVAFPDIHAEWDGFPGGTSCVPFPVDFSIVDSCDNWSAVHTATFTIVDNSSPMLTSFPSNLVSDCEELTMDEVQMWLDNNGGGQAVDNCSASLTWTYNWSGDLTQDSVAVIFRVTNLCNLSTSFQAWIIQEVTNDTIRFTDTSCNPASIGSDTVTMIAGLCTTVHIFDTLLLLADTVYLTPDYCRSGTIDPDTLHLTNQEGCDSIVFINYNIIPPDTITFLENTCDPSQAGFDTVIVSGPQCDTIHITITSLQPSDTLRLTQPVCDPLLVDVDTVFLLNQFGCDSLVITGLEFNDPTRRDTLILCGNDDDFLDTLIIPFVPCDSMIITFHDYFEPDTTILSNNSCIASEAGVFTEVLTNQIGCDSVVIETITYVGSDTTFLDNFTCIETEAGVFTSDLLNVFNCDSIVVNTISYMGIDTIIIMQSSCDPGEVDTVFISSPGPFCDTIRRIETVFEPVLIHRDTMILCDSNGPVADTLFYTNSEGCDSLSITYFDYTFINYDYLITHEVCAGDNNGSIEIASFSGGTPPYQVALLGDPPGDIFFFNNLAPGDYSIVVQDANGCADTTYGIPVISGVELFISLPYDTLIEEGRTLDIEAQHNLTVTSWTWAANDPINCPDCPDILLGPISDDQWVFAFGVSEEGCIGQDSMFIEVVPRPDWLAPNVFSPNDDGINDRFSISLNRDDIFVSRLEIFDRWGNMVHRVESATPDLINMFWDGKVDGQKLNPGVFVFRAEITIPGRPKPVRYTGDISIVR